MASKLLLFSFIISTHCFGQINIINRSLFDSSLNLVYLGVENNLVLKGFTPGNSKLTFSATNGTITDNSDGLYLLTPAKQGECIVSFYNRGQKIISKIFRVYILKDLTVRLASIKDSFATVNEIIANPFLVVESPGTFYKTNCHITAFQLSMDGPGFEDTNPYQISGHIIPSNVLNRIKKLRKGDMMLFDELRCVCNDSRVRKLKPFTITIK
jgi:hypothetical protein